MATVELTKGNFNDILSGGGTVLVDFWAEWCGPCRQFGPVFEAAAQANPDLVFGKVDTEAEVELATSFNIQSIPTLMVVREGVVLYSQPGALTAPVLDDLISQARAVDMDEVRRELAEQGQSS
jgi:thioredoxin 1